MVQARLFSAGIKVAALWGAVLVLILSLHSGAVGQGSTPQRGYQPGASYALSDIETINTLNGNLMLHLPLGQLAPGRGGFSGQLNLHYDSKLYDSKTQYYQDVEHVDPSGNPHVAIRNMLVTSDQGGWHYGTGYSLQVIDRLSQYPEELRPEFGNTELLCHWKVKVAFPDGSLHEFLPRGFGTVQDGYYDIRPDGWQTRWAAGATTQDYPYLTSTLTYYSFDGTYVRLEIQHDSDGNWWNNPWTLYFPDGTKVTNYGNRITDRNGNYVEFSNVTYNGHRATQLSDQLGRKIIIEFGGFSGGDVIHVPGVGGADLAYQVHWKWIQVYKTYSTVINDRHSPDGYPDILGFQTVVSEIDLPPESGGLKYVFGYNAADYGSAPWGTPSYGWGELNSVTTPAGAQAQYQYQLDGQNGPGFGYVSGEVLKKRITRKNLTYQQQYDGNSTPVTETWNYNDDGSSIVNPDGGIVTQLNDGQRNYRTQQPDGTVSEKLWQANRPQGFPVTYAYDESGINAYDPQRVNGYVKTEFTSLRDANGNLSKTAIKDYSYDKNGNVTGVSEYDWVDYGSVPRGTSGLPTGTIPGNAVLKRVTTNSYVRWTPDASDTSSNVSDSYWNSTSPSLKTALASSEVSNGSATLSRAEFFYDGPGNLKQQKSWDSTKGGYSNPLSAANSVSVFHDYDLYGNLTLATDARGYQTELYYGDVGGFTDLYPTQVKTAYQTGVERTETRAYDFLTSLVTRATDVDNNVSSATVYDVFGRATLVKAAEGRPEETRTRTYYSDVERRIMVKSDLNTVGDEKLVTIQHYDQLSRVRLARRLEDAATQNAADETQGIKVQTRYLVSNPCQPDDTSECLNANGSSLGSYQLVSDPYRAAYSSGAGGETTMGWTRMRNDKGGRIVAAQTFGGAGLPAPWGANETSTGTVATAYDANLTTVTDQAGKVRRSMTNGLGQLARLDEPDGNNQLDVNGGPAQPTNYTYDVLGNLTQVTQGSQTRTFVYSSLGRLSSATNPESGSINYQYDNNGNLLVKTDARNVSAHYAYDALNRLIRRWHNSSSVPSATSNNSPALPSAVGASDEINYWYDAQTLPAGAPTFDRGYASGRLVSVTYGSNSSAGDYHGYDALGRLVLKIQRTGSINYQTSAVYNRAGGITSETYPSNRTVSNALDAAGRASSVTGTLGGGPSRTYSTAITYSALGGLRQEQFGTDTPIYNKMFYNSRGQLAEIRESTTPNTTDFNRGAIINHYSEQCWGLCTGQAMTDNNGNLRKQEHWIPDNGSNSSPNQTYTQLYRYDELNRLKDVRESRYINDANPTSSWAQAYTYDRFGNRTINTNSSQTWGGVNNLGFEVQTATNRLYSPGDLNPNLAEAARRMQYDAAGNLKQDTYTGVGTRSYDAENRMTSAQGGINAGAQNYTYDGSGQRVRRKIDDVETWQVYGLGGELLAEYAADTPFSSPQKEYGYRNGQLLITAAPGSSSTPPTRTNVAQAANGGVATASSTLSSDYLPAKLIDGSRQVGSGPYSLWVDNTNGLFPDWVEVAFNGSKTIDEIDVITRPNDSDFLTEPTLTQTFTNNQGITQFVVEYWNGSAWISIPSGSVTGNNKVWRQFTFSGITTSKIRLQVTESGDHHYSRVAEVEAWTAVATPTPTRSNFALATNGAVATGSSTLSSDYPAGKVIDGLRKIGSGPYSLWVDNTYDTFPDSVEIAFNGSKTIDEIDVITRPNDSDFLTEPTLTQTFTNNQGITQFVVEYWNGSAWTAIPGTSVTGNNKVWRQFTFTSITTSKIRLRVTESGDHHFSRVAEVEAWGTTASSGGATSAPASAAPAAEINWLVPDQLGTPRMVFDKTGSLANMKRHDYLPFGEELGAGMGQRTTVQGYTTDGIRQKFTRKERDIETGLDYFLARYYSSTQGRFTSPDEFTGGPDELYYFVDDASANPTFYADLRKPQSLNKYQYAYNNPLRWVDPDGHDPEEAEPQDPKPVVPVPVPIGPGLPIPITLSPTTPGPSDQQIIRGVESVLDTVTYYTGIDALADWLRPKIWPTPAPAPTTTTTPQSQAQPVAPPAPIQYHPKKKQSTGKNKDHPKETERPGRKQPPNYRPFRRPPPKPKPTPKPPKPTPEPKPEIGPNGNPVNPG